MSQDQLGDAHSALHDERFHAVIDEQNLHLAAVVPVNCSRAIQHCYSVLSGQSRAWPHLRFGAVGQRQRDAGRDQRPLSGTDCNLCVLRDSGEEI